MDEQKESLAELETFWPTAFGGRGGSSDLAGDKISLIRECTSSNSKNARTRLVQFYLYSKRKKVRRSKIVLIIQLYPLLNPALILEPRIQ